MKLFLNWKKRTLFVGVALFFGVVILCFICWQWVLPICLPLPERELSALPASFYFDRHGALVHCERGCDYQWRIPVSRDELPEDLVKMVLAVEDRNFFEHDGFDYAAGVRAGWQLLRYRRIVSGASTITMQLMSLADGRTRSLPGKIRQIILARGWEREHDKNSILETYFNFLPYGGKIYGIESASRYYFGRSVGDLNRGEMTLLTGIPQQPNRFRPDRHLEAALRRQARVLTVLTEQNVITAAEAEQIRREPLRFRDFTLPFAMKAEDPQYFQLVAKLHPECKGGTIRCCLDSEIQKIASAALHCALDPLPSVRDGAAVVIENSTGRVRALIGTLDFQEKRTGQINGACSARSPGSSWKPFFYGEAIDSGFLCQDTLLEDSPLLFKDYRPGNYDGTFRGMVTAEAALADSLNTPAVRVLHQLGAARVLECLVRFGILPADHGLQPEKIGLSLALGGAECDLLHLTNAYSSIANGGIFRPFSILEEQEPPPGKTLWNRGTAEMIATMLRFHPLPNAGALSVAWKTGTSNGNRDAWCVAFTPQWTVGIWCGNKTGAAAAELVGGTLAAPIAGAVMQALYRNAAPPVWPDSTNCMNRELCKASGLSPSEFCSARRMGRVVTAIPLARCESCRKKANADVLQPVKILSPSSGTFLTGADGNLRLRLESEPLSLHWYLNGEYLGQRQSGEWLSLKPGKYRLSGWGGDGWNSYTVEFQVIR